MDEPVRSRHRPARRRVLTRPGPVTAPPAATRQHQPQGQDPDKPQDKSAAGKPTSAHQLTIRYGPPYLKTITRIGGSRLSQALIRPFPRRYAELSTYSLIVRAFVTIVINS